MDCLFNINVCRVCMQNEQSVDLWSERSLLEKYEFTTRLRISQEDNLPKAICSRCTARLKVAHTFIKNAHESEKNLKKFLEKINFEFKEVAQGNKCNKEFINEASFSDDDILSIMEEESHEDVTIDVSVNDKSGREYRKELEYKNINADDMQNSIEEDVDKVKDEIEYAFAKDILLIHAANEADSECENNSQLMESPAQEDNSNRERYNDINDSENDQIYASSANIIDSNEECEIRCQSPELGIQEPENNQEYDTIISSHDDTIQCKSIYDESSIDGCNENELDNYHIDNLNEEDEMHEIPLKKDEANECGDLITKIIKKENSIHRFYCDKCCRDFSTKTNLNRHMQLHEGNRPFSCTDCKKSFTQKSTLKQHMYTHTGERPYVCEVCNRGFTQCKSLIFHMRRHTGEKPFHCEYCLITFRQKDALRIHILKHHVIIERTLDGTEIFSCIICQRKFDTKFEFKTHMKVHTATGEVDNVVEVFGIGEEKLLPKVKRNFSSLNSLCLNAAVVNVSASSAAEPSRAKKFQCRKCFKCFSLKKSLIRHMRIHCVKSDDNMIECTNCNLQFSSTEVYQEHISICYQYACSACPNVAFKTIQELKMHMFDHELEEENQ